MKKLFRKGLSLMLALILMLAPVASGASDGEHYAGTVTEYGEEETGYLETYLSQTATVASVTPETPAPVESILPELAEAPAQTNSEETPAAVVPSIETAAPASFEEPTDTSADSAPAAPADVFVPSTDTPDDETPDEIPDETPADEPESTPTDAPVETPEPSTGEDGGDTTDETPEAGPADTPSDTLPDEEPGDAPTEEPGDVTIDEPGEGSDETPTDEPGNETEDQPGDTPAEDVETGDGNEETPTEEEPAAPIVITGVDSKSFLYLGDTMTWRVQAENAESIAYTITDEYNNPLASGTADAEGLIQFTPAHAFVYKIAVTATAGEQQALAMGTLFVSDGPLSLNIAPVSPFAVAGEQPLTSLTDITGGVLPYTVTWRYLVDGALAYEETKTVAEGAVSHAYLPEQDGEYTVAVTVVDRDGIMEQQSIVIPVSVNETEVPWQWTASVGDVELTGDWRKDLLAVARTQLGYIQNNRNFRIDGTGLLNAYTRYGDWYGAPYAEWCAMFISFCLEYAGVPAAAVPRDASCTNWHRVFYGMGAYEVADGYTPEPGDLMFFTEGDSMLLTHVGIVERVEDGVVTTIEGNVGGTVGRRTHSMTDSDVAGYASMRTLMRLAGVLEQFEEPEEEVALQAVISTMPRYGLVGMEASVGVTVTGGEAPYTITLNQDQITAQEAGEAFLTVVPDTFGDYPLAATVTDSLGDTVQAETMLPVSSGAAELRADWESALAAVALTGDANADAVALALSQVGYQQDENSFIMNEEGQRLPYTRYGDWAGVPFGARWDAAFVSFCLTYAGRQVTTADTATLISALGGIREKAGYISMPGDVAVLQAEDQPRLAIVAQASAASVQVVEAWQGQVALRDYDLQDETLLGFVSLNAQPEPMGPRFTAQDEVAVYEQPDLDSPVVAVIPTADTKVTLWAISEDEEPWAQISYEAILGYVPASMLREEASPAFEQMATLNGVNITVIAAPGVFPEGSTLSVELVPVYAQAEVDEAVERERQEGVNVAVSYTFDIKVLDKDGEEVIVGEDQQVQVLFSMAAAADENLSTQVYHVTEEENGDLSAAALEVETEGETVTVTTDGFSIYTVEFTYNDLVYVMQGDTTVPLSEILATLHLTGIATAVEVSDSILLNAQPNGDNWLISTLSSFTTEEWMKVTINGIVYQIKIVNDISYEEDTNVPQVMVGGTEVTFMKGLPPANVYIDTKAMDDAERNGTINVCIDPSTISTSRYMEERQVRNGKDDGWGLWVRDDRFKNAGAVIDLAYEVTITYPQCAVLSDGSKVDVVIKLKDIKIETSASNSKPGNSPDFNGLVKIFKTRKLNESETDAGRNVSTGVADWARYWYYGLEVNCTISVPGAPADGKMVYAMRGINVLRDNNNYNQFINSSKYNSFSEQVEIINTETVYVPSGHNMKIIKNTDNNRPILVGRGVGNNNTYLNGFATVVNAKSGFQFVFRAAGGWNPSSGSQTINNRLYPDQALFKLVSKSYEGGSIKTTSQGNRQGDLTPGDEVLDEGTLYVMRGKEFTYTMTPEYGYILDKVEVDDEKLESGNPDLANFETHHKSNGDVYYTYAFKNITQDHKIEVYWKPITLEVTKQVMGNMGNKTQVFNYTIDIKNGSYTGVIRNITYKKGSGAEESASLPFTFSLSHGETITFTSLPYGGKYKVTETVVDGYIVASSKKVNGSSFITASTNPEMTGTLDSALNQVTYTNTRMVATPTGIYDSPAPALWMAALAMQLLCTVVLMERRKKRHE